MRVRAKKIFAGPETSGRPGDEVEVSEQLGKSLIADGAAELIAAPPKPKVAAPPKKPADKVASAKAPDAGVETGKAPDAGRPAAPEGQGAAAGDK